MHVEHARPIHDLEIGLVAVCYLLDERTLVVYGTCFLRQFGGVGLRAGTRRLVTNAFVDAPVGESALLPKGHDFAGLAIEDRGRVRV